MRHANIQGALRDGDGDGCWVGSSSSEHFSPASGTMSGLSLPFPGSLGGGNAVANEYEGGSANGENGGDQSRQFQPVRGYIQGTSTASQRAFNQDRPTEQQTYPLSPNAWSASTPQPAIQCPTPPNESPEITQDQLNLLPDLQPVLPMPPSLYSPILTAMAALYELEIRTPLDHLPSSLFSDGVPPTERACDGDTLDQARAFEIYDMVAVEGSEGYSASPFCSSDASLITSLQRASAGPSGDYQVQLVPRRIGKGPSTRAYGHSHSELRQHLPSAPRRGRIFPDGDFR